MLYSVYKDLLFGAYYIDAATLIQNQHLFDALLNNIAFEDEGEPENTKTYNQPIAGLQSVIDGLQSGDDDSRLEGKVIAVHAVRGMMLKHDAMCGPVGMRTIGQRITAADAQADVIAHVVLFETGGGQAIAVPELTDAIKGATKKVYGFVDGYAMSAGQYGLAYCDEKWASRSTDMLGSIGTMTSFVGRKSGEADQNGVKQFRVYATKSTEKNKEIEEALNNGNIEFTIKHLDKLNDQFHQDMRTNYPMIEEKHLTGATFQAQEVVGVLLDGIKPLNELFEHITQQYLAATPETNIHQNSQTMKQFETLNSTLGVDALESADGTVALNEEQMETIDTALTAGATAQSNVETAQQAQRDAEAAQQTAADALVVAQERIAELEEQVPGADSTQTHKPIDTAGGEPVNSELKDMQDSAKLFKLIQG